MTQVSNKPIVNVSGGISKLKSTQPKQRKRHSTFFLTISTNQKYKQDDPHLQSDATFFEKSIRNILDNVNDYIKTDVEWSPETIHSADIDFSVEIGHDPRGSALHAHLLFRFQHQAKLFHLDYQAIKKKLLDDLGLKNIYVFNRVIRGGGTVSLLEYIDKYN